MEVWLCDTQTGSLLSVLDVSAAPWSSSLGGVGEVAATLPTGGLSAREARELWASLTPWSSSLAVVTDAGVIEAGPIITVPAEVSGGLQVRAAGLWALLDRRLVGTLDLVGFSLAGIVRALVEHGIDPARGADFPLPIRMPSVPAGASERHYLSSALASVWQRVSEVSQVQGGPNVALAPYLRPDGLGIGWDLRVGSTVDPLLHQSGQDWQVDAGGEGGTASGLTVTRDGSRMATSVTAVGAIPDGDTEPLLETSAASIPGMPALQRTISHTSVIVPATLAGHASAERVRSSRPTSTWALSVEPGDGFPLGVVRPGDWISVAVDESSRTIPPGLYRSRLLSMSGGLTGHVRVDLMPTLEAR